MVQKHHIKEIHSWSSLGRDIKPDFMPLFSDAPSDSRKTIFNRNFSKVGFLKES